MPVDLKPRDVQVAGLNDLSDTDTGASISSAHLRFRVERHRTSPRLVVAAVCIDPMRAVGEVPPGDYAGTLLVGVPRARALRLHH